jgi:surface polysaccharide O-acyltransferase-like enzyme
VEKFNVPLSNLRAVVIVIVVAFHSVLPYLASQPAHPFPFDAEPYKWIAFPIIDHERWFGFDLFCAWQDVSLMSLMFFLAGLFTPASLNRKGGAKYLSERWWQIGMPFFLAVGFLSPITYFAAYRATTDNPSVEAFWQDWLALPMWPSGPQWFLWQVFVLGALAAGLHGLAPKWEKCLSRIGTTFNDRPVSLVGYLIVVSMIAYVPLALLFTPWDWSSLGPFSLQLSRPLHYLVYFFMGYAIGANPRELLRSELPLARQWLGWLAAAIALMSLWGGLTSLTLPDWNASPLAYRVAAALAFPPACAAGVTSLLAISLRFMRSRDRVLDSLSTNAYSIYLLHYSFVVWLQYAMLGAQLNAISKAGVVFAAALGLSWGASVGIKRLGPRHALGTGNRTAVNHAR